MLRPGLLKSKNTQKYKCTKVLRVQKVNINKSKKHNISKKVGKKDKVTKIKKKYIYIYKSPKLKSN